MTRSDDDRFRVELVGGHSIVARRVLAATGLVDELPDIDGLAEHWGRDVIHCPFCHGYEVRDRPIVQIVTHPMGLHTAGLFRQLTARLTLVLHDDVDVERAEVDALRAAGVAIVHGQVRRIVTDDDGEPLSRRAGRRRTYRRRRQSRSAPDSGCVPNRSRRSASDPRRTPPGSETSSRPTPPAQRRCQASMRPAT